MTSHFLRGAAAVFAFLVAPAFAQDVESDIGRPGGIASTNPIGMERAPAGGMPTGGRIGDLVAGRASVSPPASSASIPSSSPDALGFVLTAEQLPWPLRYRELAAPGALYIPLPDAASLRIMLPGHALEEGRLARRAVAKYITDLIGVASQDRTRQLDAFVTWTEQTLKQKATLSPTDAWQQYVFWGQVHASVEAYRAGVAPQSDAVLRGISEAIPKFVADVTNLMEAAQGYEQRMVWYQVLTQLKEGLQLYQLQMQAGDDKILQAITSFVESNPAPARPEGSPPSYDQATGKRAMPKPVEAPRVDIGAPSAKREPAPPAAAPASQGEPVVAYTLVALVIAAVLGGILKLRRRKNAQPPKP